MRYILIGCGRIAPSHIKAAKENSLDIVALCDTDISKAKELLSTSSMRTSEIAYAVGYNDPHYFSYLFKKNTGLSPRDFRKDDKIG